MDFKPEAALLLDADGDVLLANSRFEQLTGFSEQDWTDLMARQVLLVNETEDNPFDIKHLREFNQTMFLLTSRNKIQLVRVSVTEIEGQKFLCLINPASAVGESESLHAGVSDLQSVPLKTTEVKINSIPDTPAVNEPRRDLQHDLRTALNGILGFSSLLLKEEAVQLEPKLSGYVSHIFRNSNKLKKLIENEVGPEGGNQLDLNLSVVDLWQLIGKLKQEFDTKAHESGVEINVIPGSAVKMLSDSSRIEVVLAYFLETAVRYTRTDEVKITGSINQQNSCFELVVDNLGLDIPDSVIKELNRQYQYARYNLQSTEFAAVPGLKQVLNEINLLETKLTFLQGDHFGQILTFSFNSCFHEGSADAEEELSAKLTLRQPAVLIVEDDKINAQVLKVYLKDVKDVVIAFSGNEALNILARRHDSGSAFDFVLMDIGLPEPWNGVLLKQEMIRRWPGYGKVPVIAQTAFVHRDWTDQIEAAAFQGVLTKPVRRLELLYMLHKLMIHNL